MLRCEQHTNESERTNGKSYHFLVDYIDQDRVGLLISHQKKQAIPIHTDIDLPFDEEKMGCIADLIAEQFDSYCRSKEN